MQALKIVQRSSRCLLNFFPGLRAADEVVRAGALGAVVQRTAVGALAARVLQGRVVGWSGQFLEFRGIANRHSSKGIELFTPMKEIRL